MEKLKGVVKDYRLGLVISAICYIGMWGIAQYGYSVFFREVTVKGMTLFTVALHLLHLLFGIALYAIPYETLICTVRRLISDYGDRQFWEEEGKKAACVTGWVVLYVVAIGLGCLYYKKAPDFRIREYGDVIVMLFSFLSAVVIVCAVEYLWNKWYAMFLTLVVICANTYFLQLISGKFLLAGVIFVAEILLWILYSAVAGKFSFRVLFVELVMAGISFIGLIFVTNHYSKVHLYEMGFGFFSGGEMLKQVWERGSVKSFAGYGSYPFSYIRYAMGWGGVAVFGLFFIAFCLASVFAIVKFLPKSRKRSGIAMGSLLFFVGAAVYLAFSEIGVLPVSTIRLFDNQVNLPILFLAFRLFEIRPPQELFMDDFDDDYFDDYFDDDFDEDHKIIPMRRSKRSKK